MSRGLEVEEIVKEKLIEKNFLILAHRQKFYGIELDLIVQRKKEDPLHIIEVKTLGEVDMLSTRVSKKQKLRISTAVNMLSENWDLPVRAHLALVTNKNKINWIKDFLVD